MSFFLLVGGDGGMVDACMVDRIGGGDGDGWTGLAG